MKFSMDFGDTNFIGVANADQNCSQYKIEIDNGFYKVEVIQYYDVDHEKYVGTNATDILLHFIKVPAIESTLENVLWCTY